MTEQQPLPPGVNLDAASSSEVADAHELTPGAFLRQAREAAGLHLAALATSLKVSVKKLEALEQDQFDLLPDAVFVRALASSVCRMLKIDPAPVLQRLPPIGAAKFVSQDRGINEPFRPRNIGPAPSVWGQVSRPAVLAGLVLLLGALVLIFLPSIRKDAVPGNPETAGPFAKVPVLQSLSALLPDTGVVPEDVATATVPAAEAALSGSGGGVVSADSPVLPPIFPVLATTAAVLVTPAPKVITAVSSIPSSVATFRATGESWVKVTDAKGRVVLNRMLGAGEVADVSGDVPLAAVVGRADVTQVLVRGQAFDLSAVSKNNVARFEVK